MEWNRSKTIGLASLRCLRCGGLGLVAGPKGTLDACACTLRKAFQICWNRHKFGRHEQRERGAPIVNIAGLGRRARRQPGAFSFTLECYLADFVLVAKRVLADDEFSFFRAVYLSGVDWNRAQEAVGMNRTQFIRVCNRVEATLGRAFSEAQPFALFPLDAYFSRPAPGSRVQAFPGISPARFQPIRPPIAPRRTLKRAA